MRTDGSGKILAVIFDNDKLDMADGGLALKAKAVTCNITSENVTNGENNKTVTVTASPTTAKLGEKVTLTATLNKAIAGKDTTVVVSVDQGVGSLTITIPKGQKYATATFTMPSEAVTFGFTSASVPQ